MMPFYRTKVESGKESIVMGSETIEAMIRDYTEAIEKGTLCMPTGCSSCHEESDDYKLHECRKRQLRVVIEDIVKVIITFLLRWKCPLCQATFTDYPPFIKPHKRFVLSDMCRFSQSYLESDKVTYRDTVKHKSYDIGYIDPESGLCEQFLSHSTIYRFMGCLADICLSLPGNVFTISHSKYRTATRRFILVRALATIRNIAQKSIFPDFETLTA